MEKILLVEPNYKNKYPPIGLMKISTYYKKKGDFVEFHKGLLPRNEVGKFDKVLITTLFTFDFEMCVQTIRYYIAIVGSENVFVGGIASTIMPEKFKQEIPEINLLEGQMTSSNILGYTDDVNVDILELDYDMLWDVSYEYPASDSYFIYTTRGCPRKCSFCAVKTLEPEFYDCNNIKYQIESVNERYGIKKNLLIMDNNILYSENFEQSMEILVDMGFGIGNNKAKKNNNMEFYIRSLKKRLEDGRKYQNVLFRIKKAFKELKYTRISKVDKEKLEKIVKEIEKDVFKRIIIENEEYIIDFFGRYNFHKITRYVDFNQGLDARLFTDKKAEIMARVAVKPCRIAFDNISTTKDYKDAMETAIRHGIKHFSNYLLYNYDEKPADLWERLRINIELCKKHSKENISLFSFPMKYASIKHTDRKYVGQYWNKKYLRAMNVILNVTSGVVAKEEDFFYRAFGNDKDEFIRILTMPDDFIRFRDFFEENGLTQLWNMKYNELSNLQKSKLLKILENIVDNPELMDKNYDEQLDEILKFYQISKKKAEKNIEYYLNVLR